MDELTVLLHRIFLARRWRPEVEVYDTMTLTLERHLTVDEPVAANDMTSSAIYDCLYIVARGYGNRYVHRVEPSTGTTTKWPIDDKPR